MTKTKGFTGSARGAAVVGSGPNGLAAAVTLARAGVPVTVFEAATTAGGSVRTEQTIAPGIVHDVGSAVHPLALATGFFQAFELERRVSFVTPNVSYANPMDHAREAAIAYRSLTQTADELGRDGSAYRRYIEPVLSHLGGALDLCFGGSMWRWPSDLTAAMWVAARSAEQGSRLWDLRFKEEAAPALIAGVAAHSIGRQPNLASAGVGLILGVLGHVTGWPVPIGGSQSISNAMLDDISIHGGRVVTGHPIDDIRELDAYDVKIFDTSTRGLLQIAGVALPPKYRRSLARFSFGDGVAKVDFVLSDAIPWRDPRVAEAPTVHLGGSREEITASERQVSEGLHPDKPFVLLTQPHEFDPRRNPGTHHAVSAYTHVPHHSSADPSDRVIDQIERFAPGFRDLLLAHQGTSAAQLEASNRNYHGGDFGSGRISISQLFSRPVPGRVPWRTPIPGVYLASSSTTPGPGVHGLSGWYAARDVLALVYGLPEPDLKP